MHQLKWSDEYKIHIRLIDTEHQNLFDLVNLLGQALERGMVRSELSNAISGLAHYVTDHFHHEERIMEDYGFPLLRAHKHQHRELERKVHAIRKVFVNNSRAIDPEKLMAFLGNWLQDHIIGSDMMLGRHIRGESILGAEPSASSTGRSSDVIMEPRMAVVELEVPVEKAALLRRCASILRRGGTTAMAIEEIADPIASMSLKEAKMIARSLMR